MSKETPSADHRITADEWNATFHPGLEVVVTLDNGQEWRTSTRSEAWNLGHGQPVVMLEGKSGGYSLARVRPATQVLS